MQSSDSRAERLKLVDVDGDLTLSESQAIKHLQNVDELDSDHDGQLSISELSPLARLVDHREDEGEELTEQLVRIVRSYQRDGEHWAGWTESKKILFRRQDGRFRIIHPSDTEIKIFQEWQPTFVDEPEASSVFEITYPELQRKLQPRINGIIQKYSKNNYEFMELTPEGTILYRGQNGTLELQTEYEDQEMIKRYLGLKPIPEEHPGQKLKKDGMIGSEESLEERIQRLGGDPEFPNFLEFIDEGSMQRIVLERQGGGGYRMIDLESEDDIRFFREKAERDKLTSEMKDKLDPLGNEIIEALVKAKSLKREIEQETPTLARLLEDGVKDLEKLRRKYENHQERMGLSNKEVILADVIGVVVIMLLGNLLITPDKFGILELPVKLTAIAMNMFGQMGVFKWYSDISTHRLQEKIEKKVLEVQTETSHLKKKKNI